MTDALVTIGSTGLVLVTWSAMIAFGIFLYIDLRRIPKEVLGARIFLNLDKFLRGFLLLSLGFLSILVVSLPGRLVPDFAPYLVLAGSALWLSMTVVSLFWIFTALHVPGAIRKKFGIAAPTRGP